MSKKQKKYREHWYSGITEGLMTYIPGNRTYHSIQARRARKGTWFILPFIIGFIVFMVRPASPEALWNMYSEVYCYSREFYDREEANQ